MLASSFEGCQEPRDTLCGMGGRAFLALAFGADHVDDLPPAGDEVGEHLCFGVGQWSDLWPCRLDEAGDDRSIDRVGLGALAKRGGKGPDLGRVDHHDRQAGAAEPGRDDRLEAAGRLDGDCRAGERLQPLDQLGQAFAVARDGKGLFFRQDMHVQPILRYIDPNNNGGVHPNPSLRKRARFAAQATVRVRWNGRRGHKLTNGLGVPRGSRPHACHRTRVYNRRCGVR